MKAYKLLIDDSGFTKGDLFYGPLPILNNNISQGYYPESELNNVPGTTCFFESYVTGNPSVFEDMGDLADPQINKQA